MSQVGAEGELHLTDGVSRAGKYVKLRAEMGVLMLSAIAHG
jgi:uncharacterized protein YcgI (DUF1989 family)